MNEYKSRVYTERPSYADDDSPAKFQALMGIICTRLKQYPNAICSYSGGSDSDIMLDLIERTRKIFNLPPIKYVFFNTGLEMEATKRHVKETAKKYGVEIEEVRPKINIVKASREYGIPFMSKHFSQRLSDYQKKDVPMSIIDEYEKAEDKAVAFQNFVIRYPKSKRLINFLLNTDKNGVQHFNQLGFQSKKYLREYMEKYPPDFQISAKCCDYCKKQPAHNVQKDYEMIITGERRDEGGMRSVPRKDCTTMCFTETSNGQYRLRPLYYVSDEDKAWYKEHFKIKYSDAYEVYGLTRTGCCGCPISYKAIEDLELITERTACVLCEPVQGEAGVRPPKDGYLQALRKRCDEVGALLIFDEIQMGMGRSGEMFACTKYGVTPDIICLAKAFGGGMPLGAFVSTKAIMDSLQTDPVLGHITTFGGHPVCCAAGLAAMKFLQDNKIVEDVERKGALYEELLKDHPAVKEIRRAGLLLAIELGESEKLYKIMDLFIAEGILSDWFLFCNNKINK